LLAVHPIAGTHDLLKHIRTKDGCQSLAFSPDGSTLVAGLTTGEVIWLSVDALLKDQQPDVKTKDFRTASVSPSIASVRTRAPDPCSGVLLSPMRVLLRFLGTRHRLECPLNAGFPRAAS